MAVETKAARRPVIAVLPRVSRGLNLVFTWLILGGLGVLLLGNLIKTPAQFLSVMLLGITFGAIYALVALGYTLVYGIIELINFAHGDVFMWGTMISVTVAAHWLGLNGSQPGWQTTIGCLITLVAAMAFCGTLNVVIERFAYRPLRNAPKLSPLITAIGVSFMLQNAALLVYSPQEQGVGPIFPTNTLFTLGGVPSEAQVSDRRPRHDPGAAGAGLPGAQAPARARRCARSRRTPRPRGMMGIDVNRTIAFTFGLGGVLAGAAGMLFIMYQTTTRYDLGFQLGLFAFTAAVLGGIGNLTGAALGALLIGLIQAFNEGFGWHMPGSDWTQSMIFSILILVLVFRPQGLLGEQVADRA